MIRLIDDLLDISRITRDKLQLRRMRVDLASIVRHAVEASRPLAQLGHMVAFSLQAVLAIPMALRRYRREFLRMLADITWGNGSIVVGGGTAGVVLVLGITIGALVAIEGYNFLSLLGLGPATGVVSSLVTTQTRWFSTSIAVVAVDDSGTAR